VDAIRRQLHLLGLTLHNRRFTGLLLVVASPPVFALYAVGIVLRTWNGRSQTASDFTDVYLKAAAAVRAGHSPYRDACTGHGCVDFISTAASLQPPALAWLMQPLTQLPLATSTALAIVSAQICLCAFLVLILVAAGVRDWQVAVLVILLAIAWTPTLTNVEQMQPQLLLLALTGVLTLTYVSRRFEGAGGVALGIGAALKLMQAPLLAFLLWRRRWVAAAAAAGAWALVWLVAGSRYLGEYLTQVAPQLAVPNGHGANVALAGAVQRLLVPDSFGGTVHGASPLARPLALLAATAVAAVAVWALASARRDRDGRLLEVATALALAPLPVTLIWVGHLVLLLAPILILVVVGLRHRSGWVVAAGVGAWLLMGPVFGTFLVLEVNFGLAIPLLVLRLLGESAVAGQLILCAGAIYALRVIPRRRPSPAPAGVRLPMTTAP
jgi:hypothetical protein